MAQEIEEAQDIEEESEGHNGNQTGEGYGCSCGFKTSNVSEFRTHIFVTSRKEGKGSHVSIGKIDLATGKVIMPPWHQRTHEQKKTKAGVVAVASARGTEEISAANEIRFTPRVFTCDYTPIMRTAQEAAVREWGWNSNMKFDNFLDTILHTFFKDRGIILTGYVREDRYAS